MASGVLGGLKADRKMHLLGLAFVFRLISVRVLLLRVHIGLALGGPWRKKSIL